MREELLELDALRLREAYREGSASPVEAAEAMLRRSPAAMRRPMPGA